MGDLARSGDYWLGVATPIAAACTLVTFGVLAKRGVQAARGRGWFVEFGPVPASEVSPWSRLKVSGRYGVHRGLYETTSGWGSRWLAVGPITVGCKSAALGLDEKPKIEERTEPPVGASWRWPGTTAVPGPEKGGHA